MHEAGRDSTFSRQSFRQRWLNRLGKMLNVVSLVHGYDIEVFRSTLFEAAHRQPRSTESRRSKDLSCH